MESLCFNNMKELRREKTSLEKKLNVRININGRLVSIRGNSVDEYEAFMVLEAMQLGFSAKKALSLLNEDIIFRKIPIKSFTRRKNMQEVRGRIIGRDGKTKRTIEEISGCSIVIVDNTLGIIGPAGQIDEATTALQNIIKGSKQANVYRFLERMNAEKKKYTD